MITVIADVKLKVSSQDNTISVYMPWQRNQRYTRFAFFQISDKPLKTIRVF